MVGVSSHLRHNLIWESEAISNTKSFQSSQEASLGLCINDLPCNSGSVLPTVTLPENNQRIRCWNREVKRAEASLAVVELIQSTVEISSNLIHRFHKGIREGGISIAKTCSDWLINKQQVVFVCPSIVILLDEQLVLLDQQKRADFLQVSSLRGRAWSAVEPKDGGIVAKLRLLSHILLPVESIGECGVALSDGQVATCYDPTIIVSLGEVQLIT